LIDLLIGAITACRSHNAGSEASVDDQLKSPWSAGRRRQF